MLTPLFMIAEVIMEMILPKLMASIIDNGVTPGNMQVIYTVGAQMSISMPIRRLRQRRKRQAR